MIAATSDEVRDEARRDDAAGLQPLSIAIAALGGEGGGVLGNWIVAAAMNAGHPVQSTSIPGVAQRTGATTYYIEVFPKRRDELKGREPLMGLYPAPGQVDVVIASELLEAGRTIQRGLVTPERTLLIASTHRMYSIAEKSAPGDGRVRPGPLLVAAETMARKAILLDMRALAERAGGGPNAVFLGLLAGSGVLPLARSDFEQAIRDAGIAVEANLAAFSAGLAHAEGTALEEHEVIAGENEEKAPAPGTPLEGLLDMARSRFPAECLPVAEAGLERLVDYQDTRYAGLYLERLEQVFEAERQAGGAKDGYRLTQGVARHLALWMAYEDVVRVADLKSRAERVERLRGEVRAAEGSPVHVTEFLKPGLEELTALLPPKLGRRLYAWGDRSGRLDRWHVPMRVRSTTVWGFLRLWLLARLRRWRPYTFRYAQEQERISAWLDAIVKAAKKDLELALEVAECARMLKGYSDTYRRGRANFEIVMAQFVDPALAAPQSDGGWPVAWVRHARQAALSDPEGTALQKAIAEPGVRPAANAIGR